MGSAVLGRLRRRPLAERADASGCVQTNNSKSLLCFVMCGSVDDGKSTPIGRLLYECRVLFSDQLAALESDSKIDGTQGDQFDFALLLDGLAAEREQPRKSGLARFTHCTGIRNGARCIGFQSISTCSRYCRSVGPRYPATASTDSRTTPSGRTHSLRLRRSHNVRWRGLRVDKHEHSLALR
jgi:hypothetical protein